MGMFTPGREGAGVGSWFGELCLFCFEGKTPIAMGRGVEFVGAGRALDVSHTLVDCYLSEGLREDLKIFYTKPRPRLWFAKTLPLFLALDSHCKLIALSASCVVSASGYFG